MHHVGELVEIHEIEFRFTQFRVQTTKLCLLKDRKMGHAGLDIDGCRATP
jgi:hypothetical protein